MTKLVSGEWRKSVLDTHVFFDVTQDGYEKQRRAFVVKALDGKFYPVVKEERYGAPYTEKRFKKFNTFEEAYKNLKVILGVK